MRNDVAAIDVLAQELFKALLVASTLDAGDRLHHRLAGRNHLVEVDDVRALVLPVRGGGIRIPRDRARVRQDAELNRGELGIRLSLVTRRVHALGGLAERPHDAVQVHLARERVGNHPFRAQHLGEEQRAGLGLQLFQHRVDRAAEDLLHGCAAHSVFLRRAEVVRGLVQYSRELRRQRVVGIVGHAVADDERRGGAAARSERIRIVEDIHHGDRAAATFLRDGAEVRQALADGAAEGAAVVARVHHDVDEVGEMELHLARFVRCARTAGNGGFHFLLDARELLLPLLRALVDERERQVKACLDRTRIPIHLVGRRADVPLRVVGVHACPGFVRRPPVVRRETVGGGAQIGNERLLIRTVERVSGSVQFRGHVRCGKRLGIWSDDERTALRLVYRRERIGGVRMFLHERAETIVRLRSLAECLRPYEHDRLRRAGNCGAIRVLLGGGREALRPPVATEQTPTLLIGRQPIDQRGEPLLRGVDPVDAFGHFQHVLNEHLLGGRMLREIGAHECRATLREVLTHERAALALRRAHIGQRLRFRGEQLVVGGAQIGRLVGIEEQRHDFVVIDGLVAVRVRNPVERDVPAHGERVELCGGKLISRRLRCGCLRLLCGVRRSTAGDEDESESEGAERSQQRAGFHA